MPITSLWSDYGIGDFSKPAYDFVDWLERAKQTYWQILPIGPTGYGDSPYQSFSTFAGNPYFVSLDDLIDEGLLKKSECEEVDFGNNKESIDYEKIYNNRFTLLKKAYNRFDFKASKEYIEFLNYNNDWLEDYALYTAVKKEFLDMPWQEWDEDIKLRKESAIIKYKETLKEEIDFYKFIQFLFYKQWYKLKKYANNKGIKIIGDIPIYVAPDSADAWKNPELFQFDEENLPIAVAGCPPDGFSKKGQLWGNPLYDWEVHKKTGYKWWIKRISHCFEVFDVLRIDHFRGFDEYYSIPYGNTDAVIGKWEKGPGFDLFKNINDAIGEKEIIAEDLGFITDSVKELVKKCEYPGMKVLEFAFDKRDENSKNDYLPHNYPKNSIVYTGTHDNQTIKSWFGTITQEERELVREYLCDFYTPDDKINIPLICLIMRSVSDVCIVPIQDYLGLDDTARINIPSTVGGNWTWRIKKEMLSDELANNIKIITKNYGRLTY